MSEQPAKRKEGKRRAHIKEKGKAQNISCYYYDDGNGFVVVIVQLTRGTLTYSKRVVQTYTGKKTRTHTTFVALYLQNEMSSLGFSWALPLSFLPAAFWEIHANIPPLSVLLFIFYNNFTLVYPNYLYSHTLCKTNKDKIMILWNSRIIYTHDDIGAYIAPSSTTL